MAEVGKAVIRVEPDMAAFKKLLADGLREMADQIDPPRTDEAGA